MQFDFLTIFPEVIKPYVNTSILKRASDNNHASYAIHDLRSYTRDKHRTVDDTPYGGGAGMVMRIEPIAEAIDTIVSTEDREQTRIILLSAKGESFSQAKASQLLSYKKVVLICGRYEGVDERVADHIADEELSVGPYVLTGGELPAMIVCDSITRLLPGVLGNSESLVNESHGKVLEATHPQYTRPENFRGWSVPKVLQEGNHAEIQSWRSTHSRPRESPL